MPKLRDARVLVSRCRGLAKVSGEGCEGKGREAAGVQVCSGHVTTNSPAAAGPVILVVDVDASRRGDLRDRLAAEGLECQGVPDAEEGLQALRRRSYDLVITACDHEDGWMEVTRWLGSHAPSTRVLALGSPRPAAQREWLTARGIPVFDQVEAALLEQARRGASRRGFFGVGIEVELFDYVQMVALSGRDKLIEVSCPGGSSVASLWFEHGDISHVEFGELVGEEAFYALLAAGAGRFTEAFFLAPPRRTVFASSMHLLMEAARRADEGTLETSDDGRVTQSYEGDGAAPKEAPVGELVATSGLEESRPGTEEPSRLEEVSDSMVMSIVHADDSGLGEASRSGIYSSAPWSASESGSMINPLDDPETRKLMLGQFFAYEGVRGVAILSSTGKVLAEEVRSELSLVTLAGFLMRGAARIARTLGQGLFDGVIAESRDGRKMLMVAMGATSAVLVLDADVDADALRREILEVQ